MPKAVLLFVDDDEMNRVLFQRLVKRHLPDCELVVAPDAQSALASLKSIQPDCAIIDVNMPGMNGIQLCRRLKSVKAQARFPILLMTSMETDADFRVRGLESGADDFIQRPSADLDLAAKIRVLLRIKRAEDELRSVNKRLAELAAARSTALHEYEERYRLLFNACRDAVMVFELGEETGSGRFIDLNDAACRLTGYKRDEILQLSLRDLFPPDRFAGMQGRIESILKRKQVFFETILLGRDAQPLPVALHVRVFDLDGQPTIVAVAQDLRRPAGSEESDSDMRFRMLAVQTGQMIYDCNLQTGEVKWGGAITQVSGYTPEEMSQRTWQQLAEGIHPNDRKRAMAEIDRALEAVSTYQLTYRIEHKSGDLRHVENLGVVLPGEDGKAYRLLGTVKDITARVREEEERRRIEQEMQHSQRLESLGVLAGGIAHDFNNILAAIIGLTDMCLQDIPKNSDTYVDLKEALQAAHRAKELVKQILAFSRQSGEERAPLYLHVVAREALSLIRASLPATIEIIDSISVHSGAVLANAAQLHQVIMNYCTNAAQAMKEKGGIIEVSVNDVDVSERLALTHPKLRPGPYVRLSVRDTGHGMEPHVQARIFDPFYTTKGPGEGTGMGLAVVHGIVTSHGGAIVVESAVGRGSIFHTYLPRVQDAVVGEERLAEHIPHGNERILFVDDEDNILHFGESLLPRLGYRVVTCRNGAEALAAFQEAPDNFDLVITDQIMPKLTGDELAYAVHQLRPNIPIVLFTGFSEQISEEKSRTAGIVDVVMKPVIAADLAERIRGVLDRHA